MPTRLPDHTTTVTRRTVLRLLLPLAAPFTALLPDVALWLRCGRQLRPA